MLSLWPRNLDSIQVPAHAAAVAGRRQLLHVHLRRTKKGAEEEIAGGAPPVSHPTPAQHPPPHTQPTVLSRSIAQRPRPLAHPLQLAKPAGGEGVGLARGPLKPPVLPCISN